jgi:hypothetical protein
MEFKHLEPEIYAELFPFFENQPYELCEYSLATLTVWANDEYRPQAAMIDDTLFLKGEFATRRDLNHLMLPLSRHRKFPPEKLRELALEFGMKSLWFVPDSYILQYGREKIESFFQINEQTAYTDYIYRQEDLAELKGNRYAKKRNLIKQFLKSYPEKCLEFKPISRENHKECLSFLERWCATRNCDEDLEDSLTCERLAAEKMLRNIDVINSAGILLRIKGRICAFGIRSHLTPDMGILQFEKAFEDIKGLYQFFDRECCRRLFTGYRFINKESDMEVPGLRKSKRSYHPLKMVHSFQFSLKE